MKSARYGLSVILGIAVTGGLLVLMYTLIEMGDVDKKPPEDRRIVDIWQEDVELEANLKVLKPKKPNEVIEPPPKVPRENLDVKDVVEVVQLNMPVMDVKGAIQVGGMGGDGEYIPIVKIAPQYPQNALQRGVEGYVVVEFTITTSGSVVDPVVVEAKDSKGRDTSIFNRSALRAATKLKYKPRVVDGDPVEVAGVLHKFTFELEK
ncbi:TonB family protein [Porticoccaceae bacterium LTM1]|nr:TonB family protein [Porticoccaceae bacterium LTM1]